MVEGPDEGLSLPGWIKFCRERELSGGTNDKLLDDLLLECSSGCSDSLFLLSADMIAARLAVN